MSENQSNLDRFLGWNLEQYRKWLPLIFNGVLFLTGASIVTMLSISYGSRLDNVKTAHELLQKDYKILLEKTEGLFEPQLFKIDTIADAAEDIYLLGGVMGLSFDYRYRTDSGMAYNHTLIQDYYGSLIKAEIWANSPDLKDKDFWPNISGKRLCLRPGEILDFEIGENKYAIKFDLLYDVSVDSQAIIFKAYKLNPIYRPPLESE